MPALYLLGITYLCPEWGQALDSSPEARQVETQVTGGSTSVSPVENLRKFTGALEVEEPSHREDEACADEECPQEEGGCHMRTPCRQTNSCQESLGLGGWTPVQCSLLN